MKPTDFLFLSPFLLAEASLIQRAPAAYHDYGELRVAVTASYDPLWNDQGSGARRDVAFWHPKQDGDFRALGSIAVTSYGDVVNGKRATLFVAMNPNQRPRDPSKPALVSPSGWTSIWTDRKSGAKMDGSIWRPTCPNGYVSIGDVVARGYGQPTAPTWCVRQDLARQGNFAPSTIWDDGGSGAAQDAFIWEVTPGSTGVSGSEDIPLYAGTFRAVNSAGKPSAPAWTIAIKIPKQYKQFSANVPSVTAKTIPSKGDLYNELVQAEVVLPMTAYFNPTDQILLNNIRNPFAKTTRSVAWYVEGVWQNGSNGKVTRSDEVQYGFSKEKTEAMEHSAGVSVTASGGIGLVDYSVSLNYQFTYSTSTSYSEFRNYMEKEEFTVPAHYVTVMFCKRIRVNVSLPDGTTLSQGDNLASGEFHLSGAPLPK